MKLVNAFIHGYNQRSSEWFSADLKYNLYVCFLKILKTLNLSKDYGFSSPNVEYIMSVTSAAEDTKRMYGLYNYKPGIIDIFVFHLVDKSILFGFFSQFRLHFINTPESPIF